MRAALSLAGFMLQMTGCHASSDVADQVVPVNEDKSVDGPFQHLPAMG